MITMSSLPPISPGDVIDLSTEKGAYGMVEVLKLDDGGIVVEGGNDWVRWFPWTSVEHLLIRPNAKTRTLIARETEKG